MAAAETLVEEQYLAVVNEEEQYSIWRAARALPAGWRAAGMKGTKEECLDWIEKTWTDMRPASVRKFMDGTKA